PDDRGRRRAREAELEARVERAIDAWRELGPEGTGRAPEDELEADLGFLDRVMAAEATRAKPRAVNLPVDVPAVAGVSVPRGRRRWAGLGVAAAGLLAVLALGPWDSPWPATDVEVPGETLDEDVVPTGPAVA